MAEIAYIIRKSNVKAEDETCLQKTGNIWYYGTEAPCDFRIVSKDGS